MTASRDPGVVEANRRHVRARGRAMTKLSKEYPRRFRRLLDEERRKEDLPPAVPFR